jgi:hypothetical protein
MENSVNPLDLRRGIEVEEKSFELAFLTLQELREMLVRHAENSPLATQMRAATKRRLSETSKQFR